MNAVTTLERVRQRLVELKFASALEILDETLERLERDEISAVDAIDLLLDQEQGVRETRRVRTQLMTSRLTPIKTLDGFDFSFQPTLDRQRVMALAELSFIERCQTVHLLGPPGVGKSHLAIALGVTAVKAKKSAYLTSLADLIDSLSKAEREGTLAQRLRYVNRVSLLIIDEVGYLPIDTSGANLFFRLVNARYEKGATILTSNRGFKEWGEIFGDNVIAAALLDRLLHRATVIEIAGHSYRLREHADLVPESLKGSTQKTGQAVKRKPGRPRKTDTEPSNASINSAQ
jgi:DNA replication protein DnaC